MITNQMLYHTHHLKPRKDDSMHMEEHIKKISNNRNLSQHSQKALRNTLKHYTRLNQLTLDELITEAETEEEKGIRWKHRKLRERLIQYQNHLLHNYKYNTTKLYMTMIKTWYHEHEIEIGKLPPINKNQARIGEPITYNDLPTKDTLKKAYYKANPVLRAIILFTISTGCGKQEVLNLTRQDYQEWIKPYTTDQILTEKIDIIPTIRLKRQKTNKHYYTFTTPEAIREISIYLNTRHDDDPKLFKVSYRHLTYLMMKMNDELGLGFVNGTTRFRMHMLRKFHATSLHSGENGLSLDEIDSLQGRGKDNIRESYFLDNPEDLKKKYIRNIDKVTILDDVHTITVDSPEVQKLREKADKIDELEKLIKKIMEKNQQP